jgi:two-component system response regulator (stage 0 sporulation protein A)
MSRKTRIVIVDDNVEFLNILCKFLSQKEEFEVAGCASDGVEAINIIKSSEPDIVILDIVMPILDGLGVLEKYRSLDISKKPQFIVTSAIGHYKTTQIAMSLGAEYFMIKPFDLEDMVSRIHQLQSVEKGKSAEVSRSNWSPSQEIDRNLEKQIAKILDYVGVPAHLNGYQYLIYAVLMVVKDLTAINSVTKILYTETAKKHKTTWTRVERSIRNAIELTWSRGDIELIYKMFKNEINEDKARPSNSDFIMMVANKVWDKANAI